jgi:hypothetical protein
MYYDTTLNDDLKGVLDSAVSAIKPWPTNDLFTATMSYEAWQARHFTPAELSQPEISGDEADPDGDGLANSQTAVQAKGRPSNRAALSSTGPPKSTRLCCR